MHLELEQPAWSGHVYACEWHETVETYNQSLNAVQALREATEEYSTFAKVFPLVKMGILPDIAFANLDKNVQVR